MQFSNSFERVYNISHSENIIVADPKRIYLLPEISQGGYNGPGVVGDFR